MNKLNTTIAVLSVCWALAICAEGSKRSKALNGMGGTTLRPVLTSGLLRTQNRSMRLRKIYTIKYDATSLPSEFLRHRVVELFELFAMHGPCTPC